MLMTVAHTPEVLTAFGRLADVAIERDATETRGAALGQLGQWPNAAILGVLRSAAAPPRAGPGHPDHLRQGGPPLRDPYRPRPPSTPLGGRPGWFETLA